MKLIRKIKRKLGIKELYTSETSKVRSLVINYCTGFGCDVGFGGDKIKKTGCDGIDLPQPYAYTGKDKVDISCDIKNEEIPVPDNTYDYVFSSHLIEDFEDTTAILNKMIRILKSEAKLILIFPDQLKYEEYCRQTSQPLNVYHVHKNMGLNFMKNVLSKMNNIEVNYLFEDDTLVDYNVIIVAAIKKKQDKLF